MTTHAGATRSVVGGGEARIAREGGGGGGGGGGEEERARERERGVLCCDRVPRLPATIRTIQYHLL